MTGICYLHIYECEAVYQGLSFVKLRVLTVTCRNWENGLQPLACLNSQSECIHLNLGCCDNRTKSLNHAKCSAPSTPKLKSTFWNSI